MVPLEELKRKQATLFSYLPSSPKQFKVSTSKSKCSMPFEE